MDKPNDSDKPTLKGSTGSGQPASSAGASIDTNQSTNQKADQNSDSNSSIKESVTEAMTDMANENKDKMASQLDGVASAIEGAADEFEENTDIPVADYVRSAADTVRTSSSRLRDTDSGNLIDSLMRTAQERPYVTAACTLVAGYALARYLRSSAEQSRGPNAYSSRRY